MRSGALGQRSPAIFAVVNADDFYGRGLLRAAGAVSRGSRPLPVRRALPWSAFAWPRPLSEHGRVSRGVATAAGGRLLSLAERTGIASADVGPGRAYSGTEIVSMNCWGFTPALFPALDRQFRVFLQDRAADPRAEFYLPAAVAAMIDEGAAVVEVLPTASAWFGITYREDQPRVKAAVEALVREGLYPAQLV